MEQPNTIHSLAETYPKQQTNEIFKLAREYENRREQEILDIAAVAMDVSIDSILNIGLEPDSNPLLREALERQYPNVAPASLVGASTERLEGIINGVKGKYFELLVVERLNNGESLGELSLGSGMIARLADSPNQAGYDIEILNEDGSIVELLQLKATTSISYVKQALTNYPGIKVATTSDIDGAADEILRTDISNQHVEEVARQQIGELSEDALTDVLHQGAEWAFDSVPFVPAVFIAITEGRAVLVGRSTIDEAISRGAKRLGTSAAFSTLGATLVALDAGIISVPSTTAARIAWERIINRIEMGEALAIKTEEISLLAR